MRARRSGGDWLKGEWALIECNDPTFTWWTTPVFGVESTDEFHETFNCDPRTGHTFFEACLKAGYTKGEWFTEWLYNYLAEWIDNAEITDEGDPFPYLEETRPSDLSIEKQSLPVDIKI
jgi:hypothetical protein